MPQRVIEANGHQWVVSSTGRWTQYTRDELTLRFSRVGANPAEERVARFSPRGTTARESALAELSDAFLIDLLGRSQPSWTTPELGYRR
jgi:hypothetical protein